MFKPNNLRRVFFGLLGLGAMRSIMNLVSFYLFSDSGVFSISVLQLIQNLLLNFSPAALTYILYCFAKRKYGEEPEEKPEKPEKPEDENLIPEEKLGKIVNRATWVFFILMMVWLVIYYGPRIK